MNIFNRLRILFKQRPRLHEGHQIQFAFRYAGVDYYELVDIFDIPCQRAFAVRDYMEELQMRTTREFLKAHVAAVDNILSNPKAIKVAELATLNKQLKERLDFIIDTETVYKMAAVYYFDLSESPYNYSFKYGMEKIRNWKKAGEALDFFGLEPVKKLAGLTILSEDDLRAYLIVEGQMTRKQLETIFTSLSESDKKKEYYQTLTSLMEQG